MLVDDPNSASGKSVIIDTLEWPPSALAAIEGQRIKIKRLQDCLEWLLENDELTNYGQKTAREALKE